jgi:hypothetical protein
VAATGVFELETYTTMLTGGLIELMARPTTQKIPDEQGPAFDTLSSIT